MNERAAPSRVEPSRIEAGRPPAALQDVPSSQGGTSGALWTLLSVFLLLLAMFAYLNSEASNDVSKAGPVIGSVQKTFARSSAMAGGDPVAGDAAYAVRAALPGEAPRRATSSSFAEELRLRLEAAGLGAGLSNEGGGLRLRLPADDFFSAGVGALRPEQDRLMDMLAAVLRAPHDTHLNRVRITVPAAPEEGLDGRRAMAFARALEMRGVTRGVLAVRVSPLSGGDVVFDFFAERASAGQGMR